jgi:hypothetical protein
MKSYMMERTVRSIYNTEDYEEIKGYALRWYGRTGINANCSIKR